MANSSLSFSLLTLVTAPERALSIHGDLIEEARGRSRIWFWSQVLRTTGALCWAGFPRSTANLFGLTASGIAVWFLTLMVLSGVVEFTVGPGTVRGTAVALVGTFLAGIIVTRFAPVSGIYACIGTVIALLPLVAYALLNARPPDSAADLLLQSAIALTVGLLLLRISLARPLRPGKANRQH